MRLDGRILPRLKFHSLVSVTNRSFPENALFIYPSATTCRRLFSGGSFDSKYPKVNENNPFDVLGIPKGSSYQEVKRRFLDLAMKHHPDISGKSDNTEFVKFRQAFESIQESGDGTARLSKQGDHSGWSDEEFLAWFYEETGHRDILFRMTLSTRKEVIDIANTQFQGGLDRGGMWEMARSMAEQEKNISAKKGGISGPIGIESGAKKDSASPRRRRRR